MTMVKENEHPADVSEKSKSADEQSEEIKQAAALEKKPTSSKMPLKVQTVLVTDEVGEGIVNAEGSNVGDGDEGNVPIPRENELAREGGGIVPEQKEEDEVKSGDSDSDDDQETDESSNKISEEKIFASCDKSFRKLRRRLDGLPTFMAGVRLSKKGSATVGHQVVLHGELLKIKKTLNEFFKENNKSGGHVKVVHDLLKTFTETERAGAAAFKSELKARLDEFQSKVEKDGKESERDHSHELNGLRNLLHQMTQRMDALEKMLPPTAVKRKSDEVEEPSPSKVTKVDNQKLSAEEKYKKAVEAAAVAKEKKKKATFNCIFCVSNEHKTVSCDKYNNTSTRKQRMEDLRICTTCGRTHPGGCRFQSSRPCAVCSEAHLTYLCATTFDKE